MLRRFTTKGRHETRKIAVAEGLSQKPVTEKNSEPLGTQ